MVAANRWCGFLPLVCLLFAVSGCHTMAPYRNASFNTPLAAAAPDPPVAKNTFAVDGQRGHPKVLMFLALSGGGSRAAYLSAATMLALQSRLSADLLAEVDVISSVSGGSVAAAYYAASRDPVLADPRLAGRLGPALSRFAVDATGRLSCRSPLSAEDRAQVALQLVPNDPDGRDLARLVQLCEAASYPPWIPAEVLDRMKADHIRHWMLRWFLPGNVMRYWTTSFDRSDIMAQTLARGLYSRRGLQGLWDGELTMNDLNPTRPYLIINATNATHQWHDDGELDEFPFGSVFTFTREDFADRLASDGGRYSLARSVMGSAAFPLVFASMTLQDFRPPPTPRCPPAAPEPCHEQRYLHVFDGGNSDNLGLRSVKRTLLQLEVEGRLQQYDRVIVLLVDAFTTPRGADREAPDPRSLISLLVDTNVSDAVDSLLQTNRDRVLGEFDSARLSWSRECDDSPEGLRQLPRSLCEALNRQAARTTGAGRPVRALNLADRLVFYHFGFEDVVRFTPSVPEGRALKRQLDKVPTSFRLEPEAAALIDRAVDLVIGPRNACMQALIGLVALPTGSAESSAAARAACRSAEAGRALAPAPSLPARAP